MERVDKHVGATKRNPSRDATVAEHRNDVSFRGAGQAGLGHPGGQFAEEGFIHVAIILKFAVRTGADIAEPPTNVRIR
jgi:hypothetical protein